MIEHIGILDERFSPYGSEDIDFCERAKKAGWKIKYVPKAKCWHSVTSKPPINPERTYHNLKNLIILARKHLNKNYMVIYFLYDFIFIHLPLLLIDSLMKNKACTISIMKALVWHIQDIKSNGLLLKE
jgi:GT2 family glycosyltransferase